MKDLVRQVSGYGVASVAALTLDMMLLWALVHAGVYYILAASVSFTSGSIVAYFISIHLAFNQHRLADRRLEFISFFLIGLAALLSTCRSLPAQCNFLACITWLQDASLQGARFHLTSWFVASSCS